jgi:hypothetical protein
VLATFGTARDPGFTSLMPTMTTMLMPMALMTVTEFRLPFYDSWFVRGFIFLMTFH